MRYLLTLLTFFFSVVAFGAEKEESQKAAVMLEGYASDFNVIFFAKIILVFVLAIAAAVSYAQFVKQDRETK